MSNFVYNDIDNYKKKKVSKFFIEKLSTTDKYTNVQNRVDNKGIPSKRIK